MVEKQSQTLEFSKNLEAHKTSIDGLVWYDLPVHGDSRGWFKENWQREKMLRCGLLDFGPVQNNVSFNAEAGVTRGLHAEPWDKFVSIGHGKIFGAWCDLREGSATYGKVYTLEMDPSRAIFVPRGVANGFQALKDNTVYMYLVNDHWSPDADYAFVNLADPELGITWPIALDKAEMSDKDKAHPLLKSVTPLKPKKVMVTGANGQLGRALRALYPEADCVDRDMLDISDEAALRSARRWRDYGQILNAAAYTAVDAAETPEGRRDAWAVNARAVGNLARIATEYGITLVHVSSEYVFDGTVSPHREDEPFSPLGVYAQSKAAGDVAAATAPRHYIVRTSWVVGKGNNFVRSIAGLAERNISPNVVADQFGRLTFTPTLAAGIKHLVDTQAPYGTYNLSNSGGVVNWADIAREIYTLLGRDDLTVGNTTAEEYFAGKLSSPRPAHSELDLTKIQATGFIPTDWRDELKKYLDTL
ncbi:bifunctional dTDP-4-dehydrorhamnose 3,5-epimerase family protein/NAD(P)-dependent oxidoreductase [Candidatus Saccharibacteria bacterium]|nr:MAG: bifunctional dTDP-4-dehydrorhamnose 3,5-epimerase family protein/NAD(P)-dependent oxidoreductase [Candidatus Saccharibacteria bacterium]